MATAPTPPPDRGLADPVDAALAGALSRVGDELCEVPADVAHGHLDAIIDLAATHAHTVPAPDRGPGSGWTAWRLRVRRLAGMTAVKIALGASVAAAGTTGGLAATGNLPAPAQQVVSDSAAWFGIQLPAPAAAEAEDAVDGEGPDEQADTDPDGQPGDPVRPVPPPAHGDGDEDDRDEDARDDRPGDLDAPSDEDEPGPPADAPEPDERPASEQRPGSGDDRPAPVEPPEDGDAPEEPAPGPARQDDAANPAGDQAAGDDAAAEDDDAASSSSSREDSSTSGGGRNGPGSAGWTDAAGTVQDQYAVVEDQSPQG